VYVNSTVLPPTTPTNGTYTSPHAGLILLDVTNSGSIYQKAPIGYSIQVNSKTLAGLALPAVANVLNIQTGNLLSFGYYNNFLYINKASIGNVGLYPSDMPSTAIINLQYTT
jgi:hypothetical protein